MAKLDIFAPQDTSMNKGLEGQKILIYGKNDCGKALTNDTVLPTPNGPKKVGDVKVGDMLFSKNGKPTKVLKVFPQGKRQVWEVVFVDGRKVQCCEDHLWQYITSRKNLGVKSTKELAKHFNADGSRNTNYQIPLCEPVKYSEKPISIPPYVLGVFIGDGCFRNEKLEYSTSDEWILNKICSLTGWAYKKNSVHNYTYTFKHEDGSTVRTDEFLVNECYDLIGTYSYEKYIPENYLYGSVEQRLEILRGLLDTDGHIADNGSIKFSTTSFKLAQNMLELCYSLGFRTTISEDNRKEKYTSGTCYTIGIVPPLAKKAKVVSLPRHLEKIEKWMNTGKKKKTNNNLSISYIYPTNEYKEMTCFVVDNDEHLYLANDYIVTHNTFQATRMKKPMLLMAESGGSARPVPKFPITDWDNFTSIVKQLTADPEKSKEVYQTIIIDTVEELVARSEEKVAKRYGVTEVGQVQQAEKGNPNGYSVARAMFKQQINLLTSQGFTVVFISHAQDIEYTDPFTGETYTKTIPYNYDKEKGSTSFVCNLCDFVFFVKAQGIDPETGKTIYSKALCKETKRAFARSRYTQMQTFIEKFTAENMIAAIEEAIQKEAENEGAGLVDFKAIDFNFSREDYIELIRPYFSKLHKLYPDYVEGVVADNLGEGRKVSSATDDEVAELGNIYNEFVSFACDRGIVIEEE